MSESSGADATLLLESTGVIIEADPAARSLLGDCRTRALADLVLAPEGVLDELLGDFRRSTSPVPARLQFRTLAGEQTRRVTGRRVSAEDSAIELVISVGPDRFSELNAALERLNREIARRQDVEDELRRVLDSTVLELERSNEALRAFARSAAHDLRAPLTVVVGFVELAQKGSDVHPNLTEQALERIGKAANGAMDIVDGLLREALVRSDVGRHDVELSTVVAWARTMLDERHVILRGGPDLPAVHVAEQAVRQLVLNLASNAAKHRGREAPVHVDVRARRTGGDSEKGPHNGEMWEVEVADDGPGVAAERREAVFADGDTSQVKGVNGAGLALCRAIVEQHGGAITLEESEAGGCAFRFTLPTALGEDAGG